MPRQIEFPMSVAVCAWCRPHELGASLGALSHGICPRHLRMMKLKLQGLGGAAPGRTARRRQRENLSEAGLMLLPL